MTDEKSGLAYDPVRDEDVQIRCRERHQRTDFDHIDGESLPVLIESDFRHDPVEACQGSYSEIIDISDDPCPNCGYDRATATHHTLAGVHSETCRACGAEITDRHHDDFEASEPFDVVESMKRDCDYVAQTSRRGINVYRRTDRLVALMDDAENRTFSVRRDEFTSLLLIILREFYDYEDAPMDSKTAYRLIKQILDVTETDDEEDGDDD